MDRPYKVHSHLVYSPARSRAERPTPGEGKYSMSLTTFKTYSVDRMDVEEMVALSAFGKAFRAELEEFGMEVPEYVDLQLRSLRRDITTKIADKLEAERKRLQAQMDGLQTPQERKAGIAKRLAQVNKQLAAV